MIIYMHKLMYDMGQSEIENDDDDDDDDDKDYEGDDDEDDDDNDDRTADKCLKAHTKYLPQSTVLRFTQLGKKSINMLIIKIMDLPPIMSGGGAR